MHYMHLIWPSAHPIGPSAHTIGPSAHAIGPSALPIGPNAHLIRPTPLPKGLLLFITPSYLVSKVSFLLTDNRSDVIIRLMENKKLKKIQKIWIFTYFLHSITGSWYSQPVYLVTLVLRERNSPKNENWATQTPDMEQQTRVAFLGG